MAKHTQCPNDWDNNAHTAWLNGHHNAAIQQVLSKLNASQTQKPKPLMQQFGYYLFQVRDFSSACNVYQLIFNENPSDLNTLEKYIVCLAACQQHQKAIELTEKHFNKSTLTDPLLWDVLSDCYFKTGKMAEYVQAGCQSLRIKDQRFTNNTVLPEIKDQSARLLTKNKKRVISFSLWGNENRYIYGSLRNLLLAKDLYPEWQLRFYIDNTVNSKTIELFKSLGAEIIIKPSNQSVTQKLSWRFEVANDKTVGYFLIRDTDSVFTIRECFAVHEWIKSDKLFHIIRDWCTHTDLILAGLWGGTAGILPNISQKIREFSLENSDNRHADQQFLSKHIWWRIKQNCLIHDRSFRLFNSKLIPGPKPTGHDHIGICEYDSNRELQLTLLKPWLEKLSD